MKTHVCQERQAKQNELLFDKMHSRGLYMVNEFEWVGCLLFNLTSDEKYAIKTKHLDWFICTRPLVQAKERGVNEFVNSEWLIDDDIVDIVILRTMRKITIRSYRHCAAGIGLCY